MNKIKGLDLKYIVVNKKHLNKLTMQEQDQLNNILLKLQVDNQYLVVNVDEDYAEEVLDHILIGEFRKGARNESRIEEYNQGTKKGNRT